MTNSHLVIIEYAILFLCGSPIMLLLGMVMFGSWKAFMHAFRLLLTPDVVSMLRGEWIEDQLASVKLIAFFLLCAGGLFLAHGMYFQG